MKKLTALLLALVLALSAVSCGQTSNPGSGNSSGGTSGTGEKSKTAEELGFPNKPISIIVPWAPGGGDDTCARKIQALAAEKYGVTIVIENVTGGSSAVAVTQVLNSKNDGYTIAQVPFAYWGLYAQGMVENGPEAFDYLSIVYEEPMCIYGKAGGRIQTLDDVLAAAKDGSLRFGRSGSVGASYCYYNMLQEAANVTFNPISYEGASRTITEILGDHCDIGLGGTTDFIAMYNEGTIVPIVSFTKEPIEELPGTPTIEEEGYDFFSDYDEITAMSMLCTPKGLDPAVKEFLQNMLNDIITMPEYQEYTDMNAMTPEVQTEEELLQTAENCVDTLTAILEKYPVN